MSEIILSKITEDQVAQILARLRQIPVPRISHYDLQKRMTYNAQTGLFRKWTPGKPRRAGEVLGIIDNQGYVRIGIKGYSYRAHQLAWFYYLRRWPEGEIHHINGDKTDNRIRNLLDVSRQEHARLHAKK